MSVVAYCPRCGTICLEDEGNNAQCSKCLFSFCTRCRERRHIGERCITPEEKLLSLQDRAKVRQLSKGNFARRIDLVNEISSIKEVLSSSVLCPHCGTAISRVSACAVTVGKLSAMAVASHGHSSEQCRIDQENLSTKVNPSDLIKEVKKELAVERSRQHPCPSCGQLNPKMGNNSHMFCWACQVHYCAQCRMVVRKSTEHYGPRGCKQHSVDPKTPQVQDRE